MSDDGRRIRELVIEQWERRLRGLQERRRFRTTSQFSSLVDEFINDFIAAAADACGQEPERLRKRIDSRGKQILAERPQALKTEYAKTRKQLSSLLNERLQIDYATTWDHVKFLLYRLSTAIGIAAVILGAAIVADRLEVELGLFRIAAF